MSALERLGLAAWLAGCLVSAYLTFEHFTHNATLACSSSGLVDCSSVTTSKYSALAGVPVAVLGLLYFLAGLAAYLVARRRLEPRALRTATLGYTGLGVAFVLYLVWAELVPLGRICIWCTCVHAIVILTFIGRLMTPARVTAAPTRA